MAAEAKTGSGSTDELVDKHTPWLSTRSNLESEREHCEDLLVLGFFMFGHLISVAADGDGDASKFFVGYLRSFC
jgi:hypothetical protein